MVCRAKSPQPVIMEPIPIEFWTPKGKNDVKGALLDHCSDELAVKNIHIGDLEAA